MRARTSLVITAAALCHLLVTLPLVTSQLLPGSFSADSLGQAPSKTSTAVTIQALQQEKEGAVYKLQGEVRILYGVYRLSADRITYDQDSGDAEAEGRVVLEGGRTAEHIEAARGTYSLQSKKAELEYATVSVDVKLGNNHDITT